LKHVEESNKHIIEETAHQVGHLPELYEDAQSEKEIPTIKKQVMCICIQCCYKLPARSSHTIHLL